MIRIAICDDDTAERGETLSAVKEYLSLRGISASVDTFSGGKGLLFATEGNGLFDIYILDVIMPEMSGIELGKTIRKMDPSGIIIFLTTSPDFAIEGYDAQAFHYLIKPVERAKLFEVLDRAFATMRRRDESVYVKTRDGTVRLLMDDIYYAELHGRAMRYVCRDRIVEGMTSSVSFRDMVPDLLADKRFYLCGASLALNLNHVRVVDKAGAQLSSGQYIDIPRTSSNSLYLAWSDYWLEGGENI